MDDIIVFLGEPSNIQNLFVFDYRVCNKIIVCLSKNDKKDLLQVQIKENSYWQLLISQYLCTYLLSSLNLWILMFLLST